MAFRVRVSAVFEDDLRETLTYLEAMQGSSRAAERVMQAVDGAKELLEQHPFIDAISVRPGFSEKAYREHVVLNYIIVFRISGEEVVFLRLFHQRQMIERFVMEW